MALADHVVVANDYQPAHSYAETDGAQTIVWINGEHDAATVDALSMLLAESIAFTRSRVIVDLSGVDFMGVAPVGVLLRARAFLERRSRSLEFRAPSRSARLILERCGIPWEPVNVTTSRVVIREAARALQSWVAVPVTARSETDTHAPAPNHSAPSKSAARSNHIGEPVSRAR